jgi:hypothetical protein
MKQTKYQNSTYSYHNTFRFPSSGYLNSNIVKVVYPKSIEEFKTFTTRENATTFLFLAHRQDPEMHRIISIIADLATSVNKLIVIDVAILPELGQKFQVQKPTLVKIYKGHPVRFFTKEFSTKCLRGFMKIKSTARWRRPEMR